MMPYIKQADRVELEMGTKAPSTAGELNYALTQMIAANNPEELRALIKRLITDYIESKGLNYQNCNDICGALVGCLMEFKRRLGEVPFELEYYDHIDVVFEEIEYFYDNIVGPYEDLKIIENGDLGVFLC